MHRRKYIENEGWGDGMTTAGEGVDRTNWALVNWPQEIGPQTTWVRNILTGVTTRTATKRPHPKCTFWTLGISSLAEELLSVQSLSHVVRDSNVKFTTAFFCSGWGMRVQSRTWLEAEKLFQYLSKHTYCGSESTQPGRVCQNLAFEREIADVSRLCDARINERQCAEPSTSKK